MALSAPTSLGTATDKTSGTTLQVASVAGAGNTLFNLGVTYENAITAGSFVVGEDYTILVPGTTNFTLVGAADSLAGTQFKATGVGTGTGTAAEHPSSVKFGTRDLRLVKNSRVTEVNSTTTTAIYRALIQGTNTRNLDITWPTALLARACSLVELTGVEPRDVGNTKPELATTDPATGVAVTTTTDDSLHIAFFGSNGPVEDTAGTLNLGHTQINRDGTTGGLAATNVTIRATYEILTATGDCRASVTGATSRRWANSIVAFSPQLEVPALDSDGLSMVTGTTVEGPDGEEYTVSSISTTPGHPFAKVTIATGKVYNSGDLKVLE